MRYVQHAAIAPHRCAVIPFIGNSNGRGFIDTGQDLRGWDPHVYVSVEAAEEMAKFIGWSPKTAEQAVQVKLAERDKRIAELEAELAEADRFRDAATYTLETFGSKVRHKPGRKAAA